MNAAVAGSKYLVHMMDVGYGAHEEYSVEWNHGYVEGRNGRYKVVS